MGGIGAGVYKYLPHSHSLQPVPRCFDPMHEEQNMLRKLGQTTVPQVGSMAHQEWVNDAAVIFLISGNVGTTAKHGGLYARFAEELVMYEAGMVAENLNLQATALGLGATPIGAFEAKSVKDIICDAEVEEEPLLMMAVGVPKGSYREHHGAARLDDEGEGDDSATWTLGSNWKPSSEL